MQSDEESVKTTSGEGASLHGLKNLKNGEDGKMHGTAYEEKMIESSQKGMIAVPKSLRNLSTGFDRPGDCGRPFGQKPDWLDMDKFRRGQRFAQDNTISIFYAMLMSLTSIFSFKDGLRPLIFTEKSSTPFAAFKRYVSAGSRFRRWYTQDPWTQGTDAAKDILVARAMHSAITRKLADHTNDEIDKRVTIPNAWCPTRENILKDFYETCEVPATGQCPHLESQNDPNRSKGINQADMAVTQWSFFGLIVLYPQKFGIHYATDEDLEAFCHVWRGLGYLLGIEEEYNFARGTLEEVRQRSSDLIEYWIKPTFRTITPEWEHMSRSLITGSSMMIRYPRITFETAFYHLTAILDLQMPRFYNSLSYTDWITIRVLKTFLEYGTKVPGVHWLVNKILTQDLERAENLTPEQLKAVEIKLSDYTKN